MRESNSGEAKQWNPAKYYGITPADRSVLEAFVISGFRKQVLAAIGQAGLSIVMLNRCIQVRL